MNSFKVKLKIVSKRILEFFLQGLLYMSPIGITIYIIYAVAKFIDNQVQPIIQGLFEMNIPGLGIILLFIFITIVGFLGQSFFASQIQLLANKLIKKVPLFETIYSSIKDFVSAFVGKEKKFDKPVLLKINPLANIEKIGFITQEDLSNLNIKNKIAVYIPFSYSFMGELYIVPADQVTPLDISSTDALKFVVSGGVTNIDSNEKK